MGKILDNVCHSQETTSIEENTNLQECQNGRTARGRETLLVYSLVISHIVDCYHVENTSQATFRRKRFHHDFMHDLTG